MTSPEWEAANEDDADRWNRYQAHTGLAPDDGLVWRDRGVIIAQLTARIGELELACQKLRDDYQGALAERDQARAEVELLNLREDIGYGVIIEGTGILLSTYDGTAKKHTRRIGMTPWVEVAE